MKTQGKILLVLILWAAAFSAFSQGKSNRNAEKPNVVVILLDDMGFSDFSCYGSEIPTPNIDALAKDGRKFSTFYNAARCCPSRASLLTGLYPHNAGMGGMVKFNMNNKGPYQGYLAPEKPTIAEVLKKAGYQTFMSGKWHVGEDSSCWPLKRGFDKYFGLIGGASNHFGSSKGRQVVEGNKIVDWPEGKYSTDVFNEKSIEYIKNRNKKKPFFLYLAHKAPHWPVQAPEEEVALHKGKYDLDFDKYKSLRLENQKSLGLLKNQWKYSYKEDEEFISKKPDNDLTKLMEVYAAMITRVDKKVGELVAYLKAERIYDNTMIFLLSDNGGCHELIAGRKQKDLTTDQFEASKVAEVGSPSTYDAYGPWWAQVSNVPFRKFKHWAHEGGIATPLIVSCPSKVKPNSNWINTPAHIMDIMPTILDAAGVSTSQIVLDGKSFMPALNGVERFQHDFLAWEHEGNKALRTDKWKIVASKNEGWELYDIVNDRTEQINLALEKQDLLNTLVSQWQAWATKIGVVPYTKVSTPEKK